MNCLWRSYQSASQTALRHQCLYNGPRRTFSLSARLDRRTLPTFLEPSTPELATLFSTLQSRVLLPQHLNEDQQKLVYKLENKAKLEAEPVEITLGDVTLPLEHINRNTDLPGQWKTIKQIVEQSKTQTDFENVLRVLEGCHDANIQLHDDKAMKIIRTMTRAGMHDVVLQAFKRSTRTGMRLRHDELILIAMRSMHLRGYYSGWDEDGTKKALSYAEQLVELMEEDIHLGKTPLVPGDPRGSPWVISTVAELAAVRAKKHTEGKDLDGKVQKYASRLMHSLFQDDFATSNLPELLTLVSGPIDVSDTKRSNSKAIKPVTDACKRAIPLHNALKVSLEVLGNDMPRHEDAQRILGEIQDALQKATEHKRQLPDKVAMQVRGLGFALKEAEGL